MNLQPPCHAAPNAHVTSNGFARVDRGTAKRLLTEQTCPDRSNLYFPHLHLCVADQKEIVRFRKNLPGGGFVGLNSVSNLRQQPGVWMHKFQLAEDMVDRVTRRVGRPHAFDIISPKRTALVVIDMQNHFVKPGFPGEVPLARDIVPNINRLAAGLRAAGGHVVWIKNSTNDTRDSWSSFHETLMTPERMATRYASMTEGAEGHDLWHLMDARPDDAQIVKKRFSAFIQGSSALEAHLRARDIDTLLIAGTATNVCCESSARDAMMLNFKVVMVSDATATYTDQEHAAALSAFYAVFGDVQTVDEALASLERGRDRVAA